MSGFAARPVIIDCNPGHDDALALMLAAGDPRLRLLGVTTVAGNQTLDKTTKNALKILALTGVAGVPVAGGGDRAQVGDLTVAEDIHGSSGLDGPDLDVPVAEVADVHGVELMRRLIVSSAEPVTLIATGPLTHRPGYRPDRRGAGRRRVDRDVHPRRDGCGSPSPHRRHPECGRGGGTGGGCLLAAAHGRGAGEGCSVRPVNPTIGRRARRVRPPGAMSIQVYKAVDTRR
jgi:hypothetical protein